MIRKLDEYIRVHTIVAFRFSGVRARAEARESHPQERTGVGPGDCSERRKQSRVCGTSHSAPSQWHSGSARVSRALSMRMGMARPLDFLRATPRRRAPRFSSVSTSMQLLAVAPNDNFQLHNNRIENP